MSAFPGKSRGARFAGSTHPRIEPLYPPSRLLRASEEQARKLMRESQELLAAAQASAKQLVEDASREASAIRERAAKEGITLAETHLSELLRNAQVELDSFRSTAVRQMVRVAIDVSERIINASLRADPGRVVSLAEAALGHVLSASNVTIRVHPDHAPTLLAGLKRSDRVRDSAVEISVVEDASLDPSSIHIETPMGGYDASVQAQLAAFERAFTELLQTEDERP